MEKKATLLILLLAIAILVPAQFNSKAINKCVNKFTLKDSCEYLRHFNVSFNNKLSKCYSVKLNKGIKYVFQLCDGKLGLSKKTIGSKIQLFEEIDSNSNALIKEVSSGSHFIFSCKKSGNYIVRISINECVHYGMAIGVLYYLGKT